MLPAIDMKECGYKPFLVGVAYAGNDGISVFVLLLTLAAGVC